MEVYISSRDLMAVKPGEMDLDSARTKLRGFLSTFQRILVSLGRSSLFLYIWLKGNPVFAIIISCFIVVASILLSLFFSVSLGGKSQVYEVVDSNTQPGIIFLGHVYNVDLTQRVISISWLVIGCGDDYKIPNTMSHNSPFCGRLSIPIDVYIDGSAVINATYDPTIMPYTLGRSGGLVYMQVFNEFQTTQSLDVSGGTLTVGPSDSNFYDAQYSFPWDFYILDTSFIAVNHDTNVSLPIVRLAPVDFTDSFSPNFTDAPVTSTFNGTSNVPGRYTHLTIRRSPLTKAFNVTIFVVNWALAFMILFITTAAYWSKKDMPDQLLLLPISVILTVPALRALMIGTPAFGILLDTLGLFPQMIIISLCSLMLLLSISLKQLKRSPPERKGSLKEYVPVSQITLNDEAVALV